MLASKSAQRAVQKGLPGLFSSWKRVMYVKGTECSELCVCMLNLVFLNHMQGE